MKRKARKMHSAFIILNKQPDHAGWSVVEWLQPLPHNWGMWARRARGTVRDLRRQGIETRLIFRGAAAPGDREIF